jgi:formylglycine-generating enzyme
MSKTAPIALAALAFMAGLANPPAFAATIIPTVPIGNPGNSPDTTGFGSVAYTYNIGATEVTNAQYVAFLNAVAATDTFNLYNSNMAGSTGGIARSGSAGAYTYASISGRANNPVSFVSFWDATRFANWLHNGQPTGPQSGSTTEDGAYTLTSAGITANSITRNASWQWAITSENEWYKAAYYQPADQGGDSDGYWFYPTSSNSISPTAANYGNVIGGLTPVGSYPSYFYGVYDMAGNAFERSDTIFGGGRRQLGGSWGTGESFLQSVSLIGGGSGSENGTVGFRVVQIPSPTALSLVGLGGMIATRRRR